MKPIVKRRDAIKLALAAGGLLAIKGVAAEPDAEPGPSFAGSWFYLEQPCAIFQQGAILLVVNERGALATAKVTGPSTFVILNGFGWDIGLVADVADHGRTINWSNNTVWTRK